MAKRRAADFKVDLADPKAAKVKLAEAQERAVEAHAEAERWDRIVAVLWSAAHRVENPL